MAMTGYGVNAAQANAYAGNYNGDNAATEVPRTIASAAGKIDALSERLCKSRSHLEALSEAIGGPRPTNGLITAKDRPPGGVVQRLNDGTDSAHMVVDDIESLLAGIQRALG